MDRLPNVIVAFCLLATLALSAWRAVRAKSWSAFAIEAVGVGVGVLILNWLFGFPTPPPVTTKGTKANLAVLATLFASMLLGMLGQVLYAHFSLPRSTRARRSIDWGTFWAPAFASPVIFIPLMATLENADIDLQALTTPRMMIFVVAFQNGFFWKGHFDRQQEVAAGETR
jgi:hypothetical protein